MEVPPAPPLEVTEVAGGRLYRLPPRELGGLRLLAVTPLILAGGGCWVLVNFFLRQAAKGALDEVAWAVVAVVTLGWARGFYSFLSLSAVIWCGRTEIEVSADGAVRALDRAGWFRTRWGKLKPGAARKLILSEFLPGVKDGGKPIPGFSAQWQLTAERDRGRKVWLAPAHPRTVLAALAARLAEDLALAAPEPTAESAPVAPQPLPVIVEEPIVPNRDVLEPPPGSRVSVERHSDGVTITVPPLGVRSALGGMIFVGLVFATVGGIVSVITLRDLLRGNAKFHPGMVIGVVFACIGVGLVLAAVQTGRKRVVLAVVGDRLLTFESGPLFSKRREWTRTELNDIDCGPSKVTVNKQNLPQLQIVAGESTPVGLLTGRDETELKWIATVLRHAMRLPHDDQTPSDSPPLSA